MIVQDLEKLLAGPLTLNCGEQFQEFDDVSMIPAAKLCHVVVRISAHTGRLLIEIQDPQSTRVLEAHGYHFEAGF